MELASYLMEIVGAADAVEIFGGRQSRVFRLTMSDGRLLMAKTLVSSMVDAEIVHARVRVVAELAEIDDRVCRPVSIAGRLVTSIVDESGTPVLLLCSEFADGAALDTGQHDDAELMGRCLAGLHSSFAEVARHDLPVVAALAGQGDRPGNFDGFQLLHGDFNAGNLRRVGQSVKVFDFEDCGYGPPVFDVANALYMVLFDAVTSGHEGRYRRFAEPFTAGYAAASGQSVQIGQVEEFIGLRVRALGRWLDDLPSAPVGIRMATPDWLATLRNFVAGYTPMSI
jgi:Ser/Thr protein kinase RdoA (MazF antagonist)